MTPDNLLQNLSAQIKSSLPAMVADELLTFIKDAQDTEKSLKELREGFDKQLKLYEELKKKYDELSKTESSNRELAIKLKEREKILDRDERNLNLSIKEAEVRMITQSKQDLFNLMWIVFKNTEVKRYLYSNEPVATWNWSYGMANRSVNETISND